MGRTSRSHSLLVAVSLASVMAMGVAASGTANDHIVALDAVPVMLVSDSQSVDVAKGDPVAGGALFVQSCSACHGWMGDGKGRVQLRGVRMPDLRDRLSVSSHSPEQTYLIIKDGGEAHGLCDKMIPAGRRLSDQDIRDLTAYVLTLPAYEYIRQTRTH